MECVGELKQGSQVALGAVEQEHAAQQAAGRGAREPRRPFRLLDQVERPASK